MAARPSSVMAVISSPFTLTTPALGVSRPARIPNSVDLPDPEGPIIASASPSITVRLISSRIRRTPSEVVTSLVI